LDLRKNLPLPWEKHVAWKIFSVNIIDRFYQYKKSSFFELSQLSISRKRDEENAEALPRSNKMCSSYTHKISSIFTAYRKSRIILPSSMFAQNKMKWKGRKFFISEKTRYKANVAMVWGRERLRRWRWASTIERWKEEIGRNYDIAAIKIRN
jgi:hypothetical protein